MIIPALVSSFLFIVPVKDTVWWNTPGGKVTEHHDETDISCTLMLYDNDSSVTFAWDEPGRTLVTALNWNWEFPDDWKVPVAMQIGDVWLSDHGDSVVIQAVAHGNAVAFTTDQAVEDLLRPADHITLRTPNAEISLQLRQGKIGVLLSQSRKCREAIGQYAG